MRDLFETLDEKCECNAVIEAGQTNLIPVESTKIVCKCPVDIMKELGLIE
jgi:hypothetical protein